MDTTIPGQAIAPLPDRGQPERSRPQEANLNRAYLGDASLTDANLSGADLTDGTVQRYAKLTRADLSGADLSWTDLSEAVLYGADFSRGILIEADLTSANLVKAEITREQLEQAGSLEGALMPNGQKYEDWLKLRIDNATEYPCVLSPCLLKLLFEKRHGRFAGKGSREVMSLGHLAPHLSQPFELLGGLDALGYHLKI
jgi:hypothetical protein